MRTKKHWFSVLGIAASLVVLGMTGSIARAQEIQRDYGPITPLSQTGRLTIRGVIRSLSFSRLLVLCPQNHRLIQFAESTNYQVIICASNCGRNRPAYWIQVDKSSGEELRIEAAFDLRGVAYYPHGNYNYSIHDDSGRYREHNAYLEIYNTQTERATAEALLYYYRCPCDSAPSIR